jgi:hypothetical protein
MLTAFFRGRMDMICGMARDGDPDDETLHEIRKKVKDLLYIRDWCRQEWPEGNETLSVFPVEGLDELSDRAGDYNDRHMGLHFLEAYLAELSEEDNGKEAPGEQALLAAWQAQHAQDKEQLVAAIDAFCRSMGGENIFFT